VRRLTVIALLVAGVCYGQDIGMLAQYWTLLGQQGPSYLYRSTNYTWATGISGNWSDTTKWSPATVAYPGYATNDAAWITNNAADFTVSVDVAPANYISTLTVSNNVGITTVQVSNALGSTNINFGAGSYIAFDGATGTVAGTLIANTSGGTAAIRNKGALICNTANFMQIGASASSDGNSLVVDNGYVSGKLALGYVTGSRNNSIFLQNGATGLFVTTSAFGHNGSNNLCVVRDPGTLLTNNSGTVYISGYSAAANNNAMVISNGASASFAALSIAATAGSQGNYLLAEGGAFVSMGNGSAIGANGSNNLLVARGAGTLVTNGSGTINVGNAAVADNNAVIVSNGATFAFANLRLGTAAAGCDGNSIVVDNAQVAGVLSVGYTAGCQSNTAFFQNGATGIIGTASGFGTAGSSNLGVVRDPGTYLNNPAGTVYVGQSGVGNTLVVSNLANMVVQTLDMGAGAGASNNTFIINGATGSCNVMHCGYGVRSDNNLIVVTNGAYMALGINYYGSGTGSNHNNGVYVGSEDGKRTTAVIGYNQAYGMCLGNGSGATNNWAIFDRGAFGVGRSASQSGIMVGYAANTSNNWVLARNGAIITNCHSIQLGYAAGCNGNWATFDNATGLFVNSYLGNTGAGWNNTLLATNNSYLSLGATFSIGDEAGSSNNLAYFDRTAATAAAVNIGNGSGANNNGLVLTNGATLTQSGNMTLSATAGGIGCYLTMDGATGTVAGTLSAGTSSNRLTVKNGSVLNVNSTTYGTFGGGTGFRDNVVEVLDGSRFSIKFDTQGSFNSLTVVSNNSVMTGISGQNFQLRSSNGVSRITGNSALYAPATLYCGEGSRVVCNLFVENGSVVTGNTVGVNYGAGGYTGSVVSVDASSILQGVTISVGFDGTSYGNIISNAGTIRCVSASPSISIIGSPTNAVYMLPGAQLEYTNLNAAGRVSLTNNWAASGVGAFIWQGTNTFRLNNAFGTNSVAAGYTFTPTLGPTNYTRLEALGNSGLLGQPLTVAGDGSALLSGAIFVCPFLTNSGVLTFSGTNSFAGSLLISTGSTNNTAAGATNYVANLYTNGSLVGDGVYGSNNIPEIKGGGYLRTAWTPYRIGPTVSLWLDASDASTLTLTSSNTVSQWKDKSGNGNNAIQNAGVTQPVYNATTMNGYPGISFDGVAQKMTFSAASGLSMAAVMRTDSGCVALGGVFGVNGSDVGLRRSNNSPTTGFNAGALNTDFTGTSTTNWINGTNLLTNAEGTNSVMTVAKPSNSFALTSIGHYTSTRYWKGTMTELILFDSTLSPADQQKLQGYLAWKYGLTNELEAAHPYKTAPP
jgi:hypothetical protein